MRGSGLLILVVGASGAGKDTLIGLARESTPSVLGLNFVEREITRACGPHDHHVEVSDDVFARRREEGYYLLDWQAHGVRYGTPAMARAALQAGISVVTIASRTVLDAARSLPWPVRVVEIRAPLPVLKERLARRDGRPISEIAGRLERASAIPVAGPNVHVIDNGGPLCESAPAFTELLTQLVMG